MQPQRTGCIGRRPQRDSDAAENPLLSPPRRFPRIRNRSKLRQPPRSFRTRVRSAATDHHAPSGTQKRHCGFQAGVPAPCPPDYPGRDRRRSVRDGGHSAAKDDPGYRKPRPRHGSLRSLSGHLGEAASDADRRPETLPRRVKGTPPRRPHDCEPDREKSGSTPLASSLLCSCSKPMDGPVTRRGAVYPYATLPPPGQAASVFLRCPRTPGAPSATCADASGSHVRERDGQIARPKARKTPADHERPTVGSRTSKSNLKMFYFLPISRVLSSQARQ